MKAAATVSVAPSWLLHHCFDIISTSDWKLRQLRRDRVKHWMKWEGPCLLKFEDFRGCWIYSWHYFLQYWKSKRVTPSQVPQFSKMMLKVTLNFQPLSPPTTVCGVRSNRYNVKESSDFRAQYDKSICYVFFKFCDFYSPPPSTCWFLWFTMSDWLVIRN